MKPYKFLFILSLVFLGLATILQLSVPFFTKTAIDNYMSQDYSYTVSTSSVDDGIKIDSEGQDIWIEKSEEGTFQLKFLKEEKGETRRGDSNNSRQLQPIYEGYGGTGSGSIYKSYGSFF